MTLHEQAEMSSSSTSSSTILPPSTLPPPRVDYLLILLLGGHSAELNSSAGSRAMDSNAVGQSLQRGVYIFRGWRQTGLRKCDDDG